MTDDMEEQILRMIVKDDEIISVRMTSIRRRRAKQITSHVMEFIEWGINEVSRLYFRDYLYQVKGTQIRFRTINELYDHWFNNVKP